MTDYNFSTVADIPADFVFAGPCGTVKVAGGKVDFVNVDQDSWSCPVTLASYWEAIFESFGLVQPADLEPCECGRGGWDDAELVVTWGQREFGVVKGMAIGLDVPTEATVVFDVRLPKVAVDFVLG